VSPGEELDPPGKAGLWVDPFDPVREAILVAILTRHHDEPDSLRWLMVMEVDMRRAGLWPTSLA
jgi:hypothetical protein